MKEYFDSYFALPYDSTASLTAVLCFLAGAEHANSWKAAQLKMGLFLANHYGRMAWFVLNSALLYTFETLVKFRKACSSDRSELCNLYYVDTPSAKSAPDPKAWEQSCRLVFRDDDWVRRKRFKKASGYSDLSHDFWLGVLSYPARAYYYGNEPVYMQVEAEFRKFCLAKAALGIQQFERVPHVDKNMLRTSEEAR